MFEIRQKSPIQYSERSELRLHFECTKVHQKCQKWSIWRFFKMLPDRPLFLKQKLVENAKIKKLKCDIFGDFQTL